MQLNINTNTISRIGDLAWEITRILGQMLPVTAFAFINLLPANALAFTQPFYQRQAFVLPSDSGLIHELAPSAYPIKTGSVIIVIATAYSSTPGQTYGNPFITASGTRVRPGVIAANFLPIGTKVRIGDTIYTVEDRMNSRYNNSYRVDIWMPSTAQARTFGARKRVIEVVALP